MCKLTAKLWNSPDRLKGVDTFIRSKFIYTDEMIETLMRPDYMLQGLERNGVVRGDCDDISILHAAILTCMEVKTRFVAIRSKKDDPNYDHVFLEAWDGFGWQWYDATVPLGTVMQYYSRVSINI